MPKHTQIPDHRNNYCYELREVLQRFTEVEAVDKGKGHISRLSRLFENITLMQ